MINIHAIRTGYPHWSQYSGFHQFIQHLDSQRFQIDLHTASDSDDDFPIKNPLAVAFMRQQVQKHGMQWYKLSDLAAEFRAAKKCLTQTASIIHYFDGEHSAQYLPKFRKVFKTATKIIATYHQPPDLIDELLDKTIIPKLDLVTVVSPTQVAYFSKFFPPDKIHLILHGINTNYFKPGKEPKEPGKFRCITVGRYLRDYNVLKQVAESLLNYKNIEFWVVSSSAAELEGLPNLKVFQGIDDAKLLKLYQTANALFLPLIDATANNALLEGIACGLPVISTLIPSVQAYLPGQKAILIKDNDPQKFVDAILGLVEHPSMCDDMAKHSRLRAEDLDWRNIALEYTKLYLDVIKN